MTDIAKYLVRNPKQVLTYLKMLSAERCLISANFGAGNKDTFLTAIMDIDEKKQIVIIDCGPKEYLNKKLLDTSVIKCSTKYKGIKVLFEARKVKKSGKPGQPAFSLPFPDSIYWIQRRQFYRIKSPLSKNSYCTLYFKDAETEEETAVDLKINDLSACGVSILNESADLSAQFPPSARLDKCTLVLENEEKLIIDLEVRNKHPLNPNNPGKTERIGCKIIAPTPRVESTILRYMQNIEREIKQKEK